MTEVPAGKAMQRADECERRKRERERLRDVVGCVLQEGCCRDAFGGGGFKARRPPCTRRAPSSAFYQRVHKQRKYYGCRMLSARAPAAHRLARTASPGRLSYATAVVCCGCGVLRLSCATAVVCCCCHMR